ncbi:MAG TPA: LysR family transcriptional regulator [Blastocatellia bacterium]|nr:LysR family transcriptional regulator [Blastocatellia bacterium]
MEFSQLETFAAIASERSFSRAAERLFRTQPAISIALRKLEEEIGVSLFDRSKKQPELTAAGAEFLSYAQRLLSLRQETQDSMTALTSLHAGKVSIAANESTSLYLLPQMILNYRKRYPNIKIEVSRSSSERLPRDLSERNLDCGILSYRPTNPELALFPILHDELTLIMSPKHPLAKARTVRINDLGNEHFIAHNVKSPARVKVIEAFQRHNTPLNITIELSTMETIKRFVEMNIGIGFVPRICVQREIQEEKLVAKQVQGFRYRRTLLVVYHRQKTHSHAAQAFLDLAREFARERPGDSLYEAQLI